MWTKYGRDPPSKAPVIASYVCVSLPGAVAADVERARRHETSRATSLVSAGRAVGLE